MFKPYNLVWFEEPTIPDDFTGYATIADATGVPLAMGENLHTEHEFELAFAHSKLAFIRDRIAAHRMRSVCGHGSRLSSSAGRGC